MRWTRSLLAIVAACGGGADDGALITVRAPLGPPAAARLEVVLANASPDRIENVDHQRISPFDIAESGALYFHQRDTAGEVVGVPALDGFVLQIAPNADRIPDTSFVPFLIARDEQDAIVGIATIDGGDGRPFPVTIEDGKLVQYFADMTPLVHVDGAAGLGSEEVMAVDCVANQTFPSGIAWRPAIGPELRLLLPDPAIDPVDASDRDLDLDCDGVLAQVGDCDDLRAEFFDGAEETCDGRDTDCDAQRFEPMPCALPANTCSNTTTGVAVCLDRGDMPRAGACTAPPSCQCAVGGPGPCNRCVLEFKAVDAVTAKPCAPALGKIAEICNPAQICDVEVVNDVNADWEALVSTDPDGAFSSRVMGVTGDLFLLVRPRAMAEFPGTAGTSVGEVFLHVDSAIGSGQVGIDLELKLGGPTDACPIDNGGISPMACGGG